MCRTRIKNFGPIKEGFTHPDSEGWIDIKKVTMFIGNQGSGKSTIAKLVSTFMWMEKALLNGNLSDLTETEFIDERCNYFRLKKYFKKQTELEFEGEYFTIVYKNEKISRKFKEPEGLYRIPKIMYVPAERSFLSSVEHADNFSDLPKPLLTFQVEYERSLEELNEPHQLPIAGYQLKYDTFKKTAYVVGEDYELELNAASSGLHSLIPLYVVSQNLSQFIATGKEDTSVSILNAKQFKKRTAELKAVGLLGNNNYGNEEAQKLAERKEDRINSMFRSSIFVNIVEEPEQNLFPSSQKEILYSLLAFNNMSLGNKLIMTSHSPYLINYLTLAVKAYQVDEELKSEMLRKKLNAVVPPKSMVNPDDLAIYELDDKEGTIIKLPDYYGIPSDKNYLNQSLADSNMFYETILEIQDDNES